MVADKWTKLKRLNELRQTDAITEAEFESEKAKLLDGPDGPRLRIGPLSASLIAAIIVVLGIAGLYASGLAGRHPSNVVAPGNLDNAMGNVAGESIAAAAPPAQPTSDQAATAFAAVYAGRATETDAQGSRLDLRPERLIPIGGTLFGLVSTGERDGGAACPTCLGAVRIDYVVWDGATFAPRSPPMRFEEPAGAAGVRPSWKLLNSAGLPTLRISEVEVEPGCVSRRATLIKLTPAGAARVDEQARSNCVPAPGSQVPDQPAENSASSAAGDD